MLTIAYPGTFDPFTLGHESIVKRATQHFDLVVVAVAESIQKEPLFSLAERLAMVQKSLAIYGSRVEVVEVKGLLASFLADSKIKLVLRGMRSISDFEFEIQMADINRRLGKNVETIFMTPNTEYIHVFSRFVREVAMLGGDVSNFVNPHITRQLMAKFGSVYSDI